MVPNAEKMPEELLSNKDLRREWEQNQKFSDDPRVTKTGRFLRKSSIDELPQLINVLKGEMSLVRPGPLIEDEL